LESNGASATGNAASSDHWRAAKFPRCPERRATPVHFTKRRLSVSTLQARILARRCGGFYLFRYFDPA